MDFFGIGTALQAAARIYFTCARRTGRTTRLVDSLRDDDTVVCVEPNQARLLNQLCREKGVKAHCLSVPVDRLDAFAASGYARQGRVVFDHVFVEQFYEHELRCAAAHLAELEKRLSRAQAEPLPTYAPQRDLRRR
jgi:hypothetical protein